MKFFRLVMIVARTREKSRYLLVNNDQDCRGTYRSGGTRHQTCESYLLAPGHSHHHAYRSRTSMR